MSAAAGLGAVRPNPSGTVTFLFTDIESSTRLLEGLGAGAFAEALAEHRRVLRGAFAAHGGVEQGTAGDSFFVAFGRAADAVAAAAEGQAALAGGQVRVRMGIHTGEPLSTEDDYVGIDVHRAARIAAAGHGGQILISQSVRDLVGARFELRDLGPHRLKDLAEPERLYQLGDGDFPPLKSLDQTNLPVQPTPLVGRASELENLLTLMRRDDVRLVTLTGIGGSGKTRLALQAAAESSGDFADGVWFVDLSALDDPELVAPAISRVLGSREELVAYLRPRRQLIVVDNFEQLLGGSPLIAELLAAAPRLKLLVTSRVPLHLRGEHELPVPPLQPDEAVALFCARARGVRPDFEADEHVAAICRRLDGLPLALELAAARVRALTSEQLLVRLDRRLSLLTEGSRDLPERQRTLRGTIAWSYDLLDDDARLTFLQLSVFAGGCTLDAAEEVCGADLDTLESLVDKSLVRATDGRFSMLETIREFASEGLESAAGGLATQVRRRHSGYFSELAERAAGELTGRDQSLWLESLERDHANLRAALEWLLEADADGALRLAASLWRFWLAHGHLAEGANLLSRAIPRAPAAHRETRARALNGVGSLSYVRGDLGAATRAFGDALALWRAEANAAGAAAALANLGLVAAEEGDLERAEALLEESLRLRRAADDSWGVSKSLNNLGLVALYSGDYARAEELYTASLELSRAHGDDQATTDSLLNKGRARLYRGDGEGAASLIREALLGASTTGDKWAIAECFEALAISASTLGVHRDAARLIGAGGRIRDEIGASLPPNDRDRLDRAEALGRAALGDEGFARAHDDGRGMGLADAIAAAVERPA